MNFLALVQRLVAEAGISGGGPNTVANQRGEYLNAVRWVQDGWRILQTKNLWDWMWEDASVAIPAGANFVEQGIPARRYIRESARIGDSRLTFLDWRSFANSHTSFQAGQPSTWTIRPDGAFVVDRKPAADTTVMVERYRNPTELANNDDVPAMPEHLHMAIVWKALIEASDYDEAGVARGYARAKYAELLGDVHNESTTPIEFGAPLLTS